MAVSIICHPASIEASHKDTNGMSTSINYEVAHKFRGQGKVDEAEDWIRANAKGLWALEFLGMQEEIDGFTNSKTFIFHVRFKFGRSEDMSRFKNEFIGGKPPAPVSRPKVAPTKKTGFLAKLFG
jgi:hypothetical protein